MSQHNSSENENEETIPENGRHHDDDEYGVDENIENADMQEPMRVQSHDGVFTRRKAENHERERDVYV